MIVATCKNPEASDIVIKFASPEIMADWLQGQPWSVFLDENAIDPKDVPDGSAVLIRSNAK